MNLSRKVSDKWKHLSKKERSGLTVLIIFILGILIFSFGIGIGEAFYGIFGK
jgi:hypothetical protein